MPEPKFVPKDCTLAVAIGSPDVVKMLIIGSGDRAEQVATMAAQVAEKAEQAGGFNPRCVIWITEVAGDDTQTLNELVHEPYPTVAILNRDNTLGSVVTD